MDDEVFKEALSKTIKPKPGKPRAILFNGPPGSGKDEGAKAVCNISGLTPVHRGLAVELKTMTCRFFDTGKAWFYYENMKDKPHQDFRGMTPREAYIWMSEEVIKPKFGKLFWVEKLLEYYDNIIHKNGSSLKSAHTNPLIVSDLGFIYELRPIQERFGSINVLVIQVHRSGFDFKNDSRQYMGQKGSRFFDIHNNSTLADYKAEVIDVARTFLEG